MNKLSH